MVLSGGWPGRAFGRMGTLVVRMMGSSVLVEDVVDVGLRLSWEWLVM